MNSLEVTFYVQNQEKHLCIFNLIKIRINYDLKLKQEEVYSLIKYKGYRNPEEIKTIMEITKNVPLFFVNFLETTVKYENDDSIKKLRDRIKKFIEGRAERFYLDYYSKNDQFRDDKDRTLFRKIVYNLDSPTEFFEYNSIKNIMDYQLFEFEYLHDLANFSEQKKVTLTDIHEKENPPIQDFFNFIENKTECEIKSKFYLRQNFNKVRVISRYPSVISMYSNVFKKYGENLDIPGLLNMKIRDYINYFYYSEKRSKQNAIDINDPRKRIWGPIFEDILNLYIKENKTSKFVVIPEELRFLDKWEVQKYFDAVSNVSETEQKAEKNIFHKKDERMLFSNYPPRGKEFLFAVFQGLSFINFTENEQTIDGGFVYWKTEILEDFQDRLLEETEENVFKECLENSIGKE